MLIRLLQDAVIDGAVWPGGYVVNVDEQTAELMENRGVCESLEETQTHKPIIHEQGPAIMDVMVFVPVYRLEPETVQAVMGLEWGGAISHLFQRDNPHGPMRDELKRKVMNHLHQYQRGREIFLKGTYDAMLIVESDIIPPADALVKLANVGADVAYGVYRFRGSDIINIFERYPDNSGRRARNVGESLTVRQKVFKQAVRQRIYTCSGAGFGCVLIRRRVLDAIEFRMEYPKNGAYCDTWFTEDVYHAGYTQAADMTVICGHKDVDGTVLWPKYPRGTAEIAEYAELIKRE
jgi:hypothetical protein